MRLINNLLLIDIKLKIKLPCANRIGNITFLIGNCEADLYQFCLLNICAD